MVGGGLLTLSSGDEFVVVPVFVLPGVSEL